MQPQKLCLKWNNHTVNLLSVLGSFQQKDILVDVTISCEGKNIKAHKMVLSACSPYFQNIFLENPCQHPIVIINGIKYEDITAILNFMYKGEVNVSQDGLSSFLQAAEALKVKGLAEVCGEQKGTNSINQEAQQHNEQSRPQRTDTPTRKKHRNRKRSLSDSNKSDDEGTARKHHREPSSPEIHELSGDESYTGDNTSNGPPFHSSTPRVPQNIYSRSHQSSSNLGGEDEDDYEVEPAKLLEQQMTTESVVMNNSNSDNNLRIERIMGNATEIESSNIQEPESPPDIKPIIDYGESSAGPSDGNLMLYSEHSQPGPSNVQDGSLLHDNSHAQDTAKLMELSSKEMRKNIHKVAEVKKNTAVKNEYNLSEEKKKKIFQQAKPSIHGDSLFVKNLAVAVFGESVLATSSVTGQKCRRIKDGVAKPPLCPERLSYIKGLFEQKIVAEGSDIGEAEKRLKKMNMYIAEKIATIVRYKL